MPEVYCLQSNETTQTLRPSPEGQRLLPFDVSERMKGNELEAKVSKRSHLKPVWKGSGGRSRPSVGAWGRVPQRFGFTRS
ncbi:MULTISPECIES: hypothetical protein [Trichocoleus]|uniref:hypothetical protein n=1 Tax=Trichocoleus TaxID=450526 RepID=UPI0016866990|nr:hypothetical protein [Trichocoleus sp. FACHB-46]